jgi:hypothetical protein
MHFEVAFKLEKHLESHFSIRLFRYGKNRDQLAEDYLVHSFLVPIQFMTSNPSVPVETKLVLCSFDYTTLAIVWYRYHYRITVILKSVMMFEILFHCVNITPHPITSLEQPIITAYIIVIFNLISSELAAIDWKKLSMLNVSNTTSSC